MLYYNLILKASGFVFFALIISLNNCSSNPLVEKIISTYDTIQTFEKAIENSNNSDYEDSINYYNNLLFHCLSDKKFSELDETDLNSIKAKTSIKIVFNKDRKLMLVSWQVFYSYPTPMCSNLLFFNGEAKSISLNGTGDDNDFGDNIQYDRIYEVPLKHSINYVITGSNKCGNLCIQKEASLYSVSNGKLSKCENSFIDRGKRVTDVQFDFLINEYIKFDPNFKIENQEIICPVFNQEKTKMIGSKIINIKTSSE